jgi:hypothetical protein
MLGRGDGSEAFRLESPHASTAKAEEERRRQNDGPREAGEGYSGANSRVCSKLGRGPAETLRTQAENSHAALEALAEHSSRQREAMENLVSESVKGYECLLQSSFSHGQEYPEFEEATEAPEVNR